MRRITFAMVHSGSKGSLVNLTQVQACLGQMNVQGGRMPLQWRGRTATQFERGETGPLSRGLYLIHSWMVCLLSRCLLTACQEEGLTNAAIKTAQTGYRAQAYEVPGEHHNSY